MTKRSRTSSRFRCYSLKSGLGRVEGFSRGAVKSAGGRDCDALIISLSIGEGSGSALAVCPVKTAMPITDGAAVRATACPLPNISKWRSTWCWASACARVRSPRYGFSSWRPLGNGARKAAKGTRKAIVDCTEMRGIRRVFVVDQTNCGSGCAALWEKTIGKEGSNGKCNVPGEFSEIASSWSQEDEDAALAVKDGLAGKAAEAASSSEDCGGCGRGGDGLVESSIRGLLAFMLSTYTESERRFDSLPERVRRTR